MSAQSIADRLRHPRTAVAVAVLLTLPWVVVALTNSTGGLPTVATVAVSGVAILGAAFLLAWGAETAEKDVPTAFAIAVLAVLAVAPEYAVDALFAWQAGIDPGPSRAASLAIANITGANRILIGIGSVDRKVKICARPLFVARTGGIFARLTHSSADGPDEINRAK